MTSQEDLREIISLTIENVDLKFSKELEQLRGEVKDLVDYKIKECQEHQSKRRRFSLTSILSTLGVLIAFGAMLIAIFKN